VTKFTGGKRAWRYCGFVEKAKAPEGTALPKWWNAISERVAKNICPEILRDAIIIALGEADPPDNSAV
jgi:hypothetical protein